MNPAESDQPSRITWHDVRIGSSGSQGFVAGVRLFTIRPEGPGCWVLRSKLPADVTKTTRTDPDELRVVAERWLAVWIARLGLTWADDKPSGDAPAGPRSVKGTGPGQDQCDGS